MAEQARGAELPTCALSSYDSYDSFQASEHSGSLKPSVAMVIVRGHFLFF